MLTMMVDTQADLKRAVGERAATFVESGMVVGLGTGAPPSSPSRPRGAGARRDEDPCDPDLACLRHPRPRAWHPAHDAQYPSDRGCHDRRRGRSGSEPRSYQGARRRITAGEDRRERHTPPGDHRGRLETRHAAWRAHALPWKSCASAGNARARSRGCRSLPVLRQSDGPRVRDDNGNYILDCALPHRPWHAPLAAASRRSQVSWIMAFSSVLTQTVVIGGANWHRGTGEES